MKHIRFEFAACGAAQSLFVTFIFWSVLWSGTVKGNDGVGLRRQTFIYPPAVLADIGPRLNSEVQLGPLVDRSRSYLLDISEEEFSPAQPKPVRDIWDRVRNGFALPPLKGNLVAAREAWYEQRKDLVANISQKARRYLFHVVEAVEKRRLPMELALLPVVESGFEPAALSSAQAAGLWQFIPGTAQRYRLKLTDQYDARRDIVASTEAALDYLEFLHGMFNDWQLALAAYNWGEEAVLRAIQRNHAKGLPVNYESLILPAETRLYLPKLMAVRNIVLNPQSHGVELADIPNTPYFAEINVEVPLDIEAVARLAGSSTAEVLALNPSHKSGFISGKGKPAVLLPADRIEDFRRNIANYPLKGKDSRKLAERDGDPRTAVDAKWSEAKSL